MAESDQDANQQPSSTTQGGSLPGAERSATTQQHPPLQEANFLKEGYYDGENLRADLLDEWALHWGKRFARKDEGAKVNSTQMRRFYGDVKALQDQIEGDLKEAHEDPRTCTQQERLAARLAQIRMLKSKAAYARGRKTVSPKFEQFMDLCVNQIKSPRDFYAFTLVFEAVMGYFYGEGGEGNP